MKRNLKFYIWNYVLPSDWTLIIGLSTYNWKLMPEQVWTFWPVCLAKKNVHNYSTALIKEVYFNYLYGNHWTRHGKRKNSLYNSDLIQFEVSFMNICGFLSPFILTKSALRYYNNRWKWWKLNDFNVWC